MATTRMPLGAQATTAAKAGQATHPAPVLPYFPADLPVTFDAAGGVKSRYGFPSWDLSSQSTDGTTAITLHFYTSGDNDPHPDLTHRIREQQKALLWLHMDAGKTRAPQTLSKANYALTTWCENAAARGADLFTLLSHRDWIAEGARAMNTTYLYLSPALLKTLSRHRQQLGVPALQLKAITGVLSDEISTRPESQQTPLIPSRVYCAILGGLGERMILIEQELDVLLEAYTRDREATRNCPNGYTAGQRDYFRAQVLADLFDRLKALGYEAGPGKSLYRFIEGRVASHQLALMLEVTAFTGMRFGEVSILPLEDVLVEFEFMGSTHHEIHGSTHKLNRGVKRSTSWITSHQGMRAVRLAQRIGRVIHEQYDTPAKTGQTALLFPSSSNPYKKIARSGALHTKIGELRETLCPKIEAADIEELDRLELARGWDRSDIAVGKRWPLAFHQLRRSLAVYAHRSGMVSLPALKSQLQHITEEMTGYYGDGFCRAVNLVFDKTHFSHEWNAAKAESSYFGYAFGVLFSDEDLLGQGVQRMASAVESRSRQESLHLFEQGKLAYQETPLGGCVSTEPCKIEPLEPIPYDCLESNCVNLVVFSKRLEHVIKFQEVAVATLARDDAGSVEHRLEASHLESLIKSRNRLTQGAK
jgi:integrase